MPNIASVFKSEIARIARKEIRTEVEGLKKAVSSHRSLIVELKRRNDALEKALRQLQKAQSQPVAAGIADEEPSSVRFSAKSLASQRKRLGLSAEDCGRLLGTSGQSIYNWESGKARPRASHFEAIVAMRSLGKKQAAEIVAARKPTKP